MGEMDVMGPLTRRSPGSAAIVRAWARRTGKSAAQIIEAALQVADGAWTGTFGPDLRHGQVVSGKDVNGQPIAGHVLSWIVLAGGSVEVVVAIKRRGTWEFATGRLQDLQLGLELAPEKLRESASEKWQTIRISEAEAARTHEIAQKRADDRAERERKADRALQVTLHTSGSPTPVTRQIAPPVTAAAPKVKVLSAEDRGKDGQTRMFG